MAYKLAPSKQLADHLCSIGIMAESQMTKEEDGIVYGVYVADNDEEKAVLAMNQYLGLDDGFKIDSR